ncbi:glutamine-hydrolyzing GMP synthase subunit GuaA [candidate division WOR-3 bacterium]|nr:glutamine-hydrolyzing GMP synthase subunit GuaA [candidate division WOR-3 bacterium]
MEFNVNEFIEEKLKEIKSKIGNGSAIVATSGGVDSSVCAVLTHKAIGDKTTVVFIDDGLMRKNEPQKVINEFKKLGIKTQLINAEKKFFEALRGMEDPEIKRKAFRDTFYKTLGKVIKEDKANWLIQGTIKADIVETKKGIKTQHNVLEQIGINPVTFGLKILEPLRELYKPEVRLVGKTLGLPEKMYERMPFPGPGLATRVIGEVTPERVEIVRKATSIVEEEAKDLNPFQVFAVLLKDKATGIVNVARGFTPRNVAEGFSLRQKRVLGNIIVVRAVESKDAITADVTKIPWNILEKIQNRITIEIPSITKVLFDITPKPPSTIEYI